MFGRSGSRFVFFEKTNISPLACKKRENLPSVYAGGAVVHRTQLFGVQFWASLDMWNLPCFPISNYLNI